MSRLSASKIDLARRCLWPFRPDAGAPNWSSSAAFAGNEEHAHIERTIVEGDTEPKSETHRRWLEDWWSKNENACVWQAETKIAINPLTGETRLGPPKVGARDYSWAPWGWLVGTADAFGVERTADGRNILRVCDWKTGLAAHIKDAKDAGQMLFLGLAFFREVSKHERIDAVSLEYVLVNETRTWAPPCEVSRSTLAMFQSELLELVEQLDTSPDPKPGFWCRSEWCGYLGRCPATSGALARVDGDLTVPAEYAVAFDTRDFQSPEHAAWQYNLLKAAQARLDQATAALKDFARQTPVPLGDGRVYGAREKSRESVSLDDTSAIVVLQRYLGKRLENVIEVKKTTSKGRIDKELTAISKEKGVTAKSLKASLYAEMAEVGAIKISTYEELAEFEATKVTEVDDAG